MTVISLTNWPIAEVPAPPAVIETVPELVIDPAKSPAVPAAYDVWSENNETEPTLGADVNTSSASVYDWLKLNAAPAVS